VSLDISPAFLDWLTKADGRTGRLRPGLPGQRPIPRQRNCWYFLRIVPRAGLLHQWTSLGWTLVCVEQQRGVLVLVVVAFRQVGDALNDIVTGHRTDAVRRRRRFRLLPLSAPGMSSHAPTEARTAGRFRELPG
jgi:hypothetical protein